MTSRKPDVLVLGGGVIGLASALALLEAGRSVTILEQGATGRGSSHGNCGTLTPSHATPLAMPGVIGEALVQMFRADAPFRIKPRFDPALLRWFLRFAGFCNWRDFARISAIKAPFLSASRRLIGDLIARTGMACEYRHDGTLYVFRDARAFESSQWLPRALAEVGVPIEALDGARVEALEPALKPGVAGGYFNPDDARLRPDRYVAELARLVREAGGVVEEDTAVEGFERDGGRITQVRTSRGTWSGGEIVFALGAWSPLLARQLGVAIPIQPGKGYSITYARPGRCPRLPLVLKEVSVCVSSWDSGYRLGSTMEFAGYDRTLNRTRLDALRRGAALYLHEPEGPVEEEQWYGWRPMTPDDLPILGRVPGLDNLCLATGHGMLGVSMSAITAQLVREILTGAAPSLDLAPFRATRFG
ncbi:NAD(P)/FAD-dependent oxidoreductase [Dokdonella sp. MW10]|uniref:NAD(P)/FAD-dependent oxidoreductase n=1 Tax=Dokdonella sp. MW10 TaxID=2992926 RepID=UPI003F81B644